MNTTPNPVDVHVGGQIRAFRKAAGLSQDTLADRCDVTFQQIQKYERAANRVSCSMLWKICTALNVTPAQIFDGLDVQAMGDIQAEGGAYSALIQDRGGYELAHIYLALDPRVRQQLLNVARALRPATISEAA